ncbi:phospholipase A2 inhibitor NAI-like isoform X3 [Bufo gargarizans]|uniref:phospholipase A2 inhibitor NAI-like isoform X1 n=1 Tax=Bufo gargarizans TaxID=30331 RepID=UPI001CF5C7D8|nr:phospholipase A2 inhibitor NAI-like isoform X1 [Bufo gargarizans]XP_044130980.1 phospholipase A2 inhibitor NAI-like isoform X2 [Bufo gargarizans]XP_044130981.1 phospholipase A2 inhibitor NAI-like isoform X3 [Bufo gargarizans]
MSSLIGILSLLSALAATSYTLLCTYCISNETTCSGTMLSMTCYSGLQCASTYTETTIDQTISSNPNGLVCRSCISADSTSCYTNDTVQCTGDENRCLFQTTKVSGSVSASTAFRGCATKSICDIGSESASINEMIRYVNYTCTSGGLSVHNIVLAPAIVCLLLLKLFF